MSHRTIRIPLRRPSETIISLVLLAHAAFPVLAAESRPAETDWAKLKACVEQEANQSEDEGYVPHRTRELLQAAQGQTPERAQPILLQAKGALLDLKFPTWAKELRYYLPKELKDADPDRAVAHLADWGDKSTWWWPNKVGLAASGFAATAGLVRRQHD